MKQDHETKAANNLLELVGAYDALQTSCVFSNRKARILAVVYKARLLWRVVQFIAGTAPARSSVRSRSRFWRSLISRHAVSGEHVTMAAH